MRLNWKTAAMLVVSSSAISFAAADGRIPVYQVPTTISAPGSYYLTQDLNGAALAGDVITLSAGNVTLDLNGHTVTANTGYACVKGLTLSGIVRVTNGALVNGNRGCYFTSSGTVRLDHLFVSGQSSGGGALDVTGLSSISQAFVESNTIQLAAVSSDDGIDLAGERGGLVASNVVSGASYGYGISLVSCSGLRLESNALTGCNNGLYCNFLNNATIAGNTISQCAGSGTWLANLTNSQVRNNTVSGNTGDGIRTANGQRNVFEWNTCAGNSGWGINFAGTTASGFIYRYNATPGNTSGGITDCCAGTNGGGNN